MKKKILQILIQKEQVVKKNILMYEKICYNYLIAFNCEY